MFYLHKVWPWSDRHSLMSFSIPIYDLCTVIMTYLGFTVSMTINLEFIGEIMTFATYDMYKDFKTIHSLKNRL